MWFDFVGWLLQRFSVRVGLCPFGQLLQNSGFGDLRRALDGFNYALVPAILGLVLLSYVGRFFRWLYYLKLLKVPVRPTVNAAIFASGLSMTISPGKLGEVLKSVFVKQASGARSEEHTSELQSRQYLV